jgi:hypothetical protein
LQTIGNYAFSYCNALQSVAIPDGVTELGANLFRESVNLCSVVFGRNIKEMGNYSFIGCVSIDTITILASEPPAVKDLSLNADSCLLRVLKNSYSAYAKHAYWSKFANISTLNTLTLEVNNVEWGTVQGAGYYDTNSDVVIFAQASEGYEFAGWSDGVVDNPRSIVLNKDIKLTANFQEKIPSNIDVASSPIVYYLKDGILYVVDDTLNYQIYDLFGNKLHSGPFSSLMLPKGVYIIVVDNYVEKIINM